jgi:ATP-binding cassette subfamily B (MDR/TAP) protein 1
MAATTAPGMTAAGVQLEGQAIDESLAPRITVSCSSEKEKPTTNADTTNAGNSATTSTNRLQVGTGEKDKKKRPPSWGQHNAKAHENVLQPSDSRSEGDTNTTVTKTGNGPNGNGNDKETPKEAATALVSFFALYRFHKPREIAVNILGLICAFMGGASQVSSSTYTLLSSLVHVCLPCSDL